MTHTPEQLFHLGIKGLIRRDDGYVLLVQTNSEHLKKHGYSTNDITEYWDLPGGRVEKGATVLDTLKREIAEELGVTEISGVHPLGMVLSNIRIPVDGETLGLILSIYTCAIPTDTVIALSDEHTSSEWVAPAEAAKRLTIKYPPEFCELIAKL